MARGDGTERRLRLDSRARRACGERTRRRKNERNARDRCAQVGEQREPVVARRASPTLSGGGYGVFEKTDDGGVRLHEAPPPSKDDIAEVAERVRYRALRWPFLGERCGGRRRR
jgi:hypothetical protein